MMSGPSAPTASPVRRVIGTLLLLSLIGIALVQYMDDLRRREMIERRMTRYGLASRWPLSEQSVRLAFRNDLSAAIFAEAVFREWLLAEMQCRQQRGMVGGAWADGRMALPELWAYPPPYPSASGDYAAEFLHAKSKLEALHASPVLSPPARAEMQDALSVAADAAARNPGWIGHRTAVTKMIFALDGVASPVFAQSSPPLESAVRCID